VEVVKTAAVCSSEEAVGVVAVSAQAAISPTSAVTAATEGTSSGRRVAGCLTHQSIRLMSVRRRVKVRYRVFWLV
jgi:hypothetical protein